ncbi:hypothetical protein JAO73_13475 [Hymenobacter sp. BT523]|nr:hypothetical protein [Hymenobacter sp. BT523]
MFRRHTTEHLPGYGMAAGVLAGFILLLLGIMAFLSDGVVSPKGQQELYMVFLLIANIMFTSTVFSQFGEKRQATVALLLPASHLEKYLVAWLCSLPLFVLAYTGIFYLIDALVLYTAARPGQTPELVNVLGDWHVLSWVVTVLAMLHGVWFLGAMYFEKTHFIRTAFVLFLLLAGLVLLNFEALRLFITPDMKFATLFANPVISEGSNFYTLRLPAAQSRWLGWVPLGLGALLWGATYFRLTEKQL